MNLITFLKSLHWRLFTSAALAAGILHIIATLAAPSATGISVFKRLSANLPVNAMQVLPPVTPENQPLPFMLPDARYAVCRFDSAAGPITVAADLPDNGWTLSIYARNGDSLYATAAVPERATRVELSIIRSEEHFSGLTPEARGVAQQGVQPLTLTAREGLVVIRAPDKGLAYTKEHEAALQRASCGMKPAIASKSPDVIR